MSLTDVFLWFAEDLIANGVEHSSPYITDVLRKGAKPRLRSLVIAVGEPADFDLQETDELSIVGLARAASFSGISQGKVRVRFEPWIEIAPIPVSRALTAASAKAGAGSQGPEIPRPLRAVPLGASYSGHLLDVLREHDSRVGPWLDSTAWRESSGRDDPAAAYREEARDAVGLAGLLAGVDIPASAYEPIPVLSRPALLDSVLANAHRADLEEELLPDDLRRFDGQMKAVMASSSVAAFRSREFELLVFSVNKKPVEIILGVDLIYWDLTHDVFTLVQYKRLEREHSSERGTSEWVYKREAEIAKQLDLMPSRPAAVESSADWRMTQTPFWFKFVRGDAARHQDGKLLQGMYIPADYLRLAIEDGSLRTGPQGGFRVGYRNKRYITRDTFVQLVQRGLIGTTKRQSDDLHAVVEDLTSSGRSVVVAVKARWNASSIVTAPDDLF